MQRFAAHSFGPAPNEGFCQKIADTVSFLKVEWGEIDGANPRSGRKTAKRLVQIVRLKMMHRYKCPATEAVAVFFIDYHL